MKVAHLYLAFRLMAKTNGLLVLDMWRTRPQTYAQITCETCFICLQLQPWRQYKMLKLDLHLTNVR